MTALQFSLPTESDILETFGKLAAYSDADLAEMLFDCSPSLDWKQGPSLTGQGSWEQAGALLSELDVSTFYVTLRAAVKTILTTLRVRQADRDGASDFYNALANDSETVMARRKAINNLQHVVSKLSNERGVKSILVFARRLSVGGAL